jgi:hypothetical protein
VSHDAVTDYLQRERLPSKHLWELGQTFIDDSADSYLIIDDNGQNKQYSKAIQMVKKQYSGAVGGLVRGIGVVNLVHTNGQGDYCPIDFRVYAKEYDGKTKNDHFQEMLMASITNKEIQARNLLFDSWYASWKNLRLAHQLGFTFYTTLKSNRLVSLDDGENFIHLNEVEWSDEQLDNGIVVKLSKISFAVKLFKLVATNGDIDWVVTNNLDSTSTAHVAQDANDVRWEVEQFHRELKQLTGSEKCQCRKQRSQRNHLANCYHAWLSMKAKARELGKTIYQIKRDLFRDYLRAELQSPRIVAFQPT